MYTSNTDQTYLSKKMTVCGVCSNTTKKLIGRKEFLFRTKKSIKITKTVMTVIPVSGGKDSTWQVLVALENNLKPLCIAEIASKKFNRSKNLNV